jgi:D-alanine--poly(phosphoribitol) ligase subunit 2
MTNLSRVDVVIMNAVNDMNALRSKEALIEKGFDLPLFGIDGQLDSLALVNLLVTIEQQAESEFGVVVTLASEKAMSQRSSPFRTLGTLRDFLLVLVEEQLK